MEKMRLVVLADLPCATRHERKVAREFREDLFKLGFSTLQDGVYTRVTDGRNAANSWQQKLALRRPKTGTVRLLALTEKQFTSSQLIAGEADTQESEIGSLLDIFL